MTYHISKIVNDTFENVVERVIELFKKQGLGVVSEINMHEKFKEKLNEDFRRYKILGTCSPIHAYQIVDKEPHIGIMLPCNVVIQEWEEKKIEVSAVNPMEAMKPVDNKDLNCIAGQIYNKINSVMEKL
jgi:uncharacterized protein (DUF302 family)